MRATIAAATMLVCAPTIASAQAFDWTAQLGKAPSELQASLGNSARCSTGGFGIPVRWVKENTVLTDDLFDPVDTPGAGIISIGGQPEPRTDYNDERRFSNSRMTTLNCTIGREASVKAFAFDDKVLRIKLSYDRCDRREMRERTFLSTPGNPLMYEACDGVDLKEKDFDSALFDAINARNSYGYN